MFTPINELCQSSLLFMIRSGTREGARRIKFNATSLVCFFLFLGCVSSLYIYNNIFSLTECIYMENMGII